ncbi:pentatricopeptide repeat-containing protein At2g17525, mitochondrial [Salvia miltiorrhiza]|uniref:pentatricopeptide repeat-containing protein At2g17525, mitochondrial n=1 Tax=Salvia miltiorrhiza TaxID=226208 RepID=UPI0025ABB9CF|nr:pentatricopeptide repeat-containing protein At2g17525, mitochondrial [Salvia miltiorrhiza]
MSNIFKVSKILIISKRGLLFSSHNRLRFISAAAASVLVPTHHQISRLILEQKSANEALKTFEWASAIPSFTHDVSTYRALIHKLCTFRQFNVVEKLLDEMPKRIGTLPDEDIFITIARGFGRARMIREVIRVLDMVAKFGKAAPSLKLLNTILDVLVKEDIDIAREFYRKKIVGIGLKGDDYTYGILMKGFCLTNRIGDGFKLLQIMKNHGVEVNVVVYNTLIHALCKNGKVGRARSMMNEMGKYSDVTFNILVSTYCNEGNLVQALVMVEKCFSSGFVPDVIALTKLVALLCSEGRISEAVEVMERVEAKGGALDVVVYNTLLEGFVKAGKVKGGCGFLRQMEVKGCLPNTETYNALILGFCESHEMDQALDLFHEMKRAGVRWDFVTFETLTYGFCSMGKTRDGVEIFELMLEERGGCGGRIASCNSILYGLYKSGNVGKALEFLNYMRIWFPRGVAHTLTILRLCEEGNADEAKLVLDEMRERGSVPSALVYASLVQEYCKKGCMKEAVELVNEMIGLEYFPVASTFNELISGFCKQGKAGIAVRLMEDLKMRGCLLDSESYGFVVDALCSEGELQQVFVMYMEMMERGIAPNHGTWNSLTVMTMEGKNRLSENRLLERLIRS